MIELDERLSLIKELVPVCDTAADIGSDHGYLGSELLLTGKVRRMVFTDLSLVSLNKSRNSAEHVHMTERSLFYLGDGFTAVPDDVAIDAAVIAGMGAETIRHILTVDVLKTRKPVLILQPNLNADMLRRHLMQNGYHISDERIAKAAGRHYVIMKAEPGRAVYSEKELLLGPVIMRKEDPNLESFAAFRIRVCEKALKGAEKGSKDDAAGALEKELTAWRNLIK